MGKVRIKHPQLKRENMDQEEFINTCEVDPVFFINKLLYPVLYPRGRVLSPKQEELVWAFKNDIHAAGIFDRQGGKTEGVAGYDTHELCFGRSRDGGTQHINLYAPILSQTDIIMGRVRQFFNNIPVLESFLARPTQKYLIEMRNGNTLQAFSASDQSHVRGYSPTIIEVEESQDISDRMYYDDILPSGSATGARILETGTAKGRNHFYSLTRYGGVKIVYQTYKQCPFADHKFIEERKKRMPRDKFNAEYMCKFLTDNNVAFATAMLDAIFHLKTGEKVKGTTSHFLGGDIGKQDETVLSVLGAKDGELYEVDERRMSAFEKYPVVVAEIVALNDEWDFDFGLLELNNVGEAIYDFLPDGLNVDGRFNTNEEKQDLVDEFTKLGEGGVDEGYKPKVHLWEDYDSRQQFYEWEAIKLKSGKIRYHHPVGQHDDIVIAKLLAVKAFVENNEVVDYGGSSESSNLRTMGSATLGLNNPMSVLERRDLHR